MSTNTAAVCRRQQSKTLAKQRGRGARANTLRQRRHGRAWQIGGGEGGRARVGLAREKQRKIEPTAALATHRPPPHNSQTIRQARSPPVTCSGVHRTRYCNGLYQVYLKISMLVIQVLYMIQVLYVLQAIRIIATQRHLRVKTGGTHRTNTTSRRPPYRPPPTRQ